MQREPECCITAVHSNTIANSETHGTFRPEDRSKGLDADEAKTGQPSMEVIDSLKGKKPATPLQADIGASKTGKS